MFVSVSGPPPMVRGFSSALTLTGLIRPQIAPYPFLTHFRAFSGARGCPVLIRVSKRFSAAAQLALYRTLELSAARSADDVDVSHVYCAACLRRALARLLTLRGAHEHSTHEQDDFEMLRSSFGIRLLAPHSPLLSCHHMFLGQTVGALTLWPYYTVSQLLEPVRCTICRTKHCNSQKKDFFLICWTRQPDRSVQLAVLTTAKSCPTALPNIKQDV